MIWGVAAILAALLGWVLKVLIGHVLVHLGLSAYLHRRRERIAAKKRETG